MKKVSFLLFILLLLLGFSGCKAAQPTLSTEEHWDRCLSVMVDGVLYFTTGRESTFERKCGTWDGEITSECSSSKLPSKNNQSNFGTGFGYQYGQREGTVEVLLDGRWFIFATEEVKQEMVKELLSLSQVVFQATVKEISDGNLLVSPLEGYSEAGYADTICVPIVGMVSSPEPVVGDVVEITYSGIMQEEKPPIPAGIISIKVLR